jgi:phosphopantothenoylcysteine decarboxylase/phosphopantothenate--cysteine ligase
MMAPAMNVRMWEHPSTQRNLRMLTDDGVFIVGPEAGEMACGEYGPGRMAEPATIADAIEAGLAREAGGPLQGKRVLLTAGPTQEPLDPVRYIANRSSGKQGYAIAAALRNLGADVVMVTGPTGLPAPAGVEVRRVQTARQMMAACKAVFDDGAPIDCAIMCAAVADYRPEIETEHKIKKERGGLTNIPLAENPDILKTVARMQGGRPQLVIGFAAETDDIVGHAEAKRQRKGCDWIIANDVSAGAHCAMGGDLNAVTILTEEGEEAWPEMGKREVAERLAQRIAGALNRPRPLKAAE